MDYEIKDIPSVKEIISGIIKENNILKGKYIGKEALSICKNIYTSLNKLINSKLSNFHWLDIHYILLEFYSNKIYKLNCLNNHDEMLQYQIYILAAFIECNLDKSYEGTEKIKSEEIGILISLFSYLYLVYEDITILKKILKDFNNNSKAINYLTIVINDDYIIESIVSNNNNIRGDYNYHLDYEYLKSMNNQITNIISDELKIDFLGFMFILRLFLDKNLPNSLQPHREELYNTINNTKENNIFCKKIIRMNYRFFLNELHIENKSIKNKTDWLLKIFNFLIIDKNNIRKDDSYINIDYRNKRPNRFDLKPIIKDGEYLVFSIESLYTVYNQWNYCFEYFYLPYDVTLDKSKGFLKNEKKIYEKKIVKDIESIFLTKKYKTFININMSSLLNDDSLSYLGDYDVIAINNVKNEILLIEAKFIKPSRDKIELLDQQKKMFGKKERIDETILKTKDEIKNYDEKFARRILYFKNNINNILLKMNLLNNNKYDIKSYMVFNRYFKPIFKNLDFDVISINELEKII